MPKTRELPKPLTSEARAAVRGSSGAGEAQSLPGRMAAPRPETFRRVYFRDPELAWARVLCEAVIDGERCTRDADIRISARDYCAKCVNEGRVPMEDLFDA